MIINRGQTWEIHENLELYMNLGAKTIKIWMFMLSRQYKLGHMTCALEGTCDHKLACKSSVVFVGFLFLHSHLTYFHTRPNLVKSLIIMLWIINWCDVVFLAGLDGFAKSIVLCAFNACNCYILKICRYESIQIFSLCIIGCNRFSYCNYRLPSFFFWQ